MLNLQNLNDLIHRHFCQLFSKELLKSKPARTKLHSTISGIFADFQFLAISIEAAVIKVATNSLLTALGISENCNDKNKFIFNFLIYDTTKVQKTLKILLM